ncbi:MAG: tripartite tricarboxylate transporter substrate binding protein [Rhodobacteraceae bacterium]|nr:tripartite tricarboxylate transporter substrate binding protein [Paracoccaceae bacterium]MCY3726161.1 tripartite tricarboxylate transporter substrate binding protein [Paracoccaceae bacterium]MYE36981.1 tripartite tricarboxylate transporter substrate binding protein [Paracoccaceae bacterium]MYG41622.1 tripartite tricarboxylate transporter substrate binding protein [Paracoccaceae bacterium]MYJ87433.1 tripartite tricarboxylate transporter substrate binding protein [Paracoccaceae bacterium]
MKFTFNIFRSLLLGLVGSLLLAMSALAEYPERPITLVVPYGPGGAADLSGKMIAATAPGYIGQPVLAVNKTGAAGVVGSTFVINSDPDGYTMLSARVGSQMGVPAMNKTIGYEWDDYTFIGMLEINPFVLVVNPESGLNSFADFEAKLKAGEEMSYSSAGVGTLLHLATAVMADSMEIDFEKLIHVPYKGGGAAANAVVSGQVDFSWQNLSAVLASVEAGRLSALAVTMPERQEVIPDVPTVNEVGYSALEKIIGWSAIYGPPDLPDEVVSKWAEVLNSLKEDRAWLRMTRSLGNIVSIMSPEETKAFVGDQYMVFDNAVNELGLRIE